MDAASWSPLTNLLPMKDLEEVTRRVREDIARIAHGATPHREFLRQAGALAGIPGVMVHGRLDLAAPLITAWELSRAWQDGELVLVATSGHSWGDPGMAEAIIGATKRFSAMR